MRSFQTVLYLDVHESLRSLKDIVPTKAKRQAWHHFVFLEAAKAIVEVFLNS